MKLLFFMLILFCITGCTKEKSNVDYSICSETSPLSMAEVEDGFYFVHDSILYYAKKTNMNIWTPVCCKMKCSHSKERQIGQFLDEMQIQCSAYIEGSEFVEKDGRLYSIGDFWDSNFNWGIYVYEILQDGSGLKKVYKIPFAIANVVSWRAMVLHGHFVIYYQYLDKNKVYQECLVRLEEDGSLYPLYTQESEMENNPFHFQIKNIRGENLVSSSFLSEAFGLENSNDQSILWRVGSDNPEQLILPEDVDYLYSYVSEDTIIYFKKKEGFYQLNLETKEEVLLQACHAEDGQGFVLNEQYFVETNLYSEEAINLPYLRYYNGKKWIEVEVPEELTTLDCYVTVESLASDRIFIKAVEKNSEELNTYLYYFMLKDKNPKLISSFKRGEKDIEENGYGYGNGRQETPYTHHYWTSITLNGEQFDISAHIRVNRIVVDTEWKAGSESTNCILYTNIYVDGLNRTMVEAQRFWVDDSAGKMEDGFSLFKKISEYDIELAEIRHHAKNTACFTYYVLPDKSRLEK